MLHRRQSARAFLTVALAIATLGADVLFSQTPRPAPTRRIVMLDGREVIEGEVLVRYRSQAGVIGRQRAEYQADSDGSETIGQRGTRRVHSRQQTTREMLATLRANPDIAFVEPNYVIRASSMPNDPSFGNLWGLLNTGQHIDGQDGVPGMDINATAAWDVTTGSRAQIVAILDSGIDWNHPDLAANVFSAPRAFSVTIGSNSVNCGAGTHGFNALTQSCAPMDDNGHGSHVAGIVGAVGNNNIGVTGVNWTANMMALKVLDSTGTGSTSDAIRAIDFAIQAKTALGADGNIRVLNASWGGPTFSQALDDEIALANNANMLFVAAAGTDGRDTDVTPHYPASSTKSNVISVAAVDNTGQLAQFSNYGATSVDLGAPGASTYSTILNNGYGYLSGTSMAAPHVAGAAALILSACSGLSTPALKSALLATVDPEATLAGRTVSGGRLNVGAAINSCLSQVTATVSGTTITAHVTNGPGNRTDWLGVFCPATSPEGSYLNWKYLNGSQTPPASGVTSANVDFQVTAANLSAGCNVRFYANDGPNKLATSNTVTSSTGSLLSINDVSVTEGNSGTTSAIFTVTVSPANASQTVTVNYATANGSASSGTDYAAASGTLTFNPGETSKTITVTVYGDTTAETNETFMVNLSNPINATISDGQGIGTIQNDDGTPSTSVTVNASSVPPGGSVSVSVANGPANRTDWVAIYAVGAANSAFQDWSYLNGQKTAPATGLANATLSLTAPTAGGTYEVRFFANDNTQVRLATSNSFTVATQPSLSINDVTLAEGNSGTSAATFTVTLNPANNSQSVTVNYATSNGSASSGSDYVAASGTLTFNAGETSKTLAVTVNGDTTPESDETFTVTLSSATNAVIARAQGVATIQNDDAAPGPSVTVNSATVSPGGSVSITVANGPANRTDWVAIYAVGAANSGFQDWSYLNGQKTAPASGLANATLSLTAPTAGGTYEVRFFANDNTQVRLATSNSFTVASQPGLSINDVTVTEGNSGTVTATFTVTLNPVNSGQTVTVNYATADGTATSASGDYVAASGTLTFAPSVATQTVSVTINGDTAVEPTETFTVNLSNAVNASIVDAQGVGTIANDDGASSASVTVNSPSVNAGGTITVNVSGGPANRTDWIGLYAAGSNDQMNLYWSYLNGSTTAPASGQSSATVQVPAPSTPGIYNVRFFANNGFTKLATSEVVVVGSAPAISAVFPEQSQSPLTVAVANGPANAGDWVGLFPVGASDAGYVQWFYMNGSHTKPASGQSSATIQFPAPFTAGNYELRFYVNNTNTRLAVSPAFTIQP